MPLFGYPEIPADKMHMAKCPWLYCVAGGGLAGSGRCFLFGIWWHPTCPRFKDEDIELTCWELENCLTVNQESYGNEMWEEE